MSRYIGETLLIGVFAIRDSPSVTRSGCGSDSGPFDAHMTAHFCALRDAEVTVQEFAAQRYTTMGRGFKSSLRVIDSVKR